MWRSRHNGAIFCPVIDGCGVTGATAALSRFPPPLMFPSVSSEAVCGCQVHPFTSLSFFSFFVPLSSRLPILECRVTAAAERL